MSNKNAATRLLLGPSFFVVRVRGKTWPREFVSTVIDNLFFRFVSFNAGFIWSGAKQTRDSARSTTTWSATGIVTDGT